MVHPPPPPPVLYLSVYAESLYARKLACPVGGRGYLPPLARPVFILNVAFHFRPPFPPTAAREIILLNYMVPSKPWVLQVQPGLQYVLTPLMCI